MNNRYLVLLVTGAAFATILAGGCAARKRVIVTTLPSATSVATVQATTTTRPSMTEATVIKDGVVYREATVQTTAKETETTAATAKPTAKPTNKPTAKPTKKPTAKPNAKAAVKTNALEAAPKSNANAQDGTNTISGIYNGAWSQVTVDATDNNNVKITVTIHDQDDANKVCVWKMGGKYNPANGTLIYSNCTKTSFRYDETGSAVSRNVAYNNGQGKVVINNGMMTWSDYQEHAADDMTFISSSQHDHRG